MLRDIMINPLRKKRESFLKNLYLMLLVWMVMGKLHDSGYRMASILPVTWIMFKN